MSLPEKNLSLVIKEFGKNLREATEIRSLALTKPPPGNALVKMKFASINESDTVFISGDYDPVGCTPPITAGLEGLGQVVAVADDVTLKVGQCVVVIHQGCFAEYVTAPAYTLVAVPSLDPGLVPVVLGGLTASITLEQEADLRKGSTVLVTAAGQGTGQLAVQMAKMVGCHVIGTCSSQDKVDFLRSIGCDRIINFSQENLGDVLGKEYPDGIDVIYERMGKETFDVCVENLAVKGRLIIVGSISSYDRDSQELAGESGFQSKLPVALMCLRKSASIRGFTLRHYHSEYPRYMGLLMSQYTEGKLKVTYDNGNRASNGPFKGLDKVLDAIEYMLSRRHIGKVIVEI